MVKKRLQTIITVLILWASLWFGPSESFHPLSYNHKQLCRLFANNVHENFIPSPPIHQRQLQIRRQPTNRKPSRYWTEPSNLITEIFNFWHDLGVTTNTSYPTIPSEMILYHYNRHDLRAAIKSNGGRSYLSDHYDLKIMPGQWKKAVAECAELQQLLQLDVSLDSNRPPQKPTKTIKQHQTLQPKRVIDAYIGRKSSGYWSQKRVFLELFKYTKECRATHNRPAVWMPRPSELIQAGLDDLRQAIYRLGGYKFVCRRAGMIPYQEWSYFDGQLDLLVSLVSYCKKYGIRRGVFPNVSEIQRNGHPRLHALIQYYGGSKFLALRLGMGPRKGASMNFGKFDIAVAVRLLVFVREDQLRMIPPFQQKAIAMPSEAKLRAEAADGEWLHQNICDFGGYENVARRLGLDV